MVDGERDIPSIKPTPTQHKYHLHPLPQFFVDQLPFALSLSRSRSAEGPLGIAGCPLFGFNSLFNPTPIPPPLIPGSPPIPLPFSPEPIPPGLYLDPSNGVRGFNPLNAFGPLGGLGRLGEFTNALLRPLRLLPTLPLGFALIKCESELGREGIGGDALFFQAFWNERG